MSCTGVIVCAWKNKAMMSAGAICGPGLTDSLGRCAPDRIASAGHIFVDEETNQLKSGIEKCEFVTYSGHRSALNISDLRTVDPAKDIQNPLINRRSDKIVARLKSQIPGCKPYEIAAPNEQVIDSQEVIGITYIHKGMDAKKYTGSEPLVYPCVIKQVIEAKHGGPQVMVTDCDNNGGASGGFVLSRRSSDGRLVVGGIFTEAGDPSLDGQPFSIENGNATISIGTNGDFAKMADNPGLRLKLR